MTYPHAISSIKPISIQMKATSRHSPIKYTNTLPSNSSAREVLQKTNQHQVGRQTNRARGECVSQADKHGSRSSLGTHLSSEKKQRTSFEILMCARWRWWRYSNNASEIAFATQRQASAITIVFVEHSVIKSCRRFPLSSSLFSLGLPLSHTKMRANI